MVWSPLYRNGIDTPHVLLYGIDSCVKKLLCMYPCNYDAAIKFVLHGTVACASRAYAKEQSTNFKIWPQ